MRVHLAAVSASLIASFLVVQPAASQRWPERTVKIVVPFPPGGNVDSAARIVADKLPEALGQPVIVEHRPGAGGLVGAEMVARAEPDGYTLLVASNGPVLFAPEMASRRAYQWRTDLSAITTISLTPLVLQIHPSVAARSLAEFFDLARRQPDTLRMPTPGLGSSNHLLSELIQSRLGLKWITVHYRGNAPATTDLIGGHVQFNIDQVSVALPFIEDRKTIGLAATGTRRSIWLPQVPTFTELGHPEFDSQTFTAMLAPAKTSAEVINRLNAELAKILGDAETRAKLNKIGAEPAYASVADTVAFLDKEDKTWIPLIRKLNIRSE